MAPYERAIAASMFDSTPSCAKITVPERRWIARAMSSLPVRDQFPVVLPAILGRDVSGEVVAVGHGVAALRVGSRVLGLASGAHAEFLARRNRQPEVFDRIAWVAVPATGDIVLGPPESADAVLTFRNLHTFVWLKKEQQMLAASFRVLRHGGVLGLTDHRAPPGGSTDPKVMGDTGYIPEAYAIQVVESAGFRPVGRSEINANPRDTKDYEGGVWALPPIAKGATLHTGGVFEGQIYQPTILSNVSLDAAVANEETFGPVVVVEVVETAEKAVEAANRTMYGLTSSILAGDTYKAFELAPRILAGIVNVNSPTVNDEIHAPMGGVRDSGWGRTGPDSLKEFQDVIWINSHSGQRQYPI
jgi:hypothetical protein